ncbi:MAG: fused signal recognition particle receptor [Chloroflexi bacterium]|nr:MAG: fused signal recognition particle receptor [Chloroflexota bacterium]
MVRLFRRRQKQAPTEVTAEVTAEHPPAETDANAAPLVAGEPNAPQTLTVGSGDSAPPAPLAIMQAPSPEAEAEELAAVMEASTRRTRGGVFGRLGGVFRRGGVDDDFWEDLEEILIGADVGVRTSATLIERVRDRARDEGARDPESVREVMRAEMVALLEAPRERGLLWSPAAAEDPPAPQVILVVGVNGAGKTTSIAKLAHAYRQDGRSVILGAGDTFRAAAIEQLQTWGERVGAPVIAHQAGADPGAVAYDTLGAAAARGVDIAIIDTAGRLQTKKNLMAELGKVRRVIEGRVPGAPHEVLLVLDATTGGNGLSQARVFGEATEVTGICLAKLDGTSKGGVVFAVANELGLPVRFVGTGEQPGDLAPFNARAFVDALFADA